MHAAVMPSWRACWGFNCSYLHAFPSYLPVGCRTKTPFPKQRKFTVYVNYGSLSWLFFMLKCWVWQCCLSVWKCISEEVHWLMLGNDRECLTEIHAASLIWACHKPRFPLKKKKRKATNKKHFFFPVVVFKVISTSFFLWCLVSSYTMATVLKKFL